MAMGINPQGNLVSRVYSQFTVLDSPQNKVTRKQILSAEKKLTEVVQKRAKLWSKYRGMYYTKSGKPRLKFTNKQRLEMDKLKKSMQEMEYTVNSASRNVQNLRDSFNGYSKSLTKAIAKNAAFTAGLITMTKTITKGISLNIQYIENLNIIERLFGDNTDAVLEWSKTTRTSFGLAQTSALKYAATLKAFMTSAGIGDLYSSAGAVIGVQLAADLASFRNVSFETSFRAILSGLAGISRTLRYNFGIDIGEEALKERFGTVGDTQSEKIMQRFILLLESSQYAVGDFQRTKNSPANQLRLLNENFKQFAFEVTEGLLPMVNMMLRTLNLILGALIRLNKLIVILGGLLTIFNIGRAINSLLTGNGFLNIITLGMKNTIGRSFAFLLQATLLSSFIGMIMGGRDRVANQAIGQGQYSYLPDGVLSDYQGSQQGGTTINIAGNATTESVEEMAFQMQKQRFKGA